MGYAHIPNSWNSDWNTNDYRGLVFISVVLGKFLEYSCV